jgi:hypothetical protein
MLHCQPPSLPLQWRKGQFSISWPGSGKGEGRCEARKSMCLPDSGQCADGARPYRLQVTKAHKQITNHYPAIAS